MNEATLEPLTEEDVRWLRDLVMEQTSTDKNWDPCRESWMKPDSQEWLAGRMLSLPGFKPVSAVTDAPLQKRE